jgi:hypothetical protein
MANNPGKASLKGSVNCAKPAMTAWEAFYHIMQQPIATVVVGVSTGKPTNCGSTETQAVQVTGLAGRTFSAPGLLSEAGRLPTASPEFAEE